MQVMNIIQVLAIAGHLGCCGMYFYFVLKVNKVRKQYQQAMEMHQLATTICSHINNSAGGLTLSRPPMH